MKIALIAPFSFPINEDFAGGLESFIYKFSKALSLKGHNVTVFCCGGSKIPGVKLEIITEKGLFVGNDGSQGFTAGASIQEAATNYKLMSDLLANKYEFDICHINSTYFLTIAMQDEKFAMRSLATLHLPVKGGFIRESQNILGKKIKMINFVAISDFQKRQPSEIHFLDRIYNGIDLNDFTYQEKDKGYYGWLGRIDPIKGIKIALELAKKHHWKFKFAGQIHDKKYFNDEIKPLVGGDIEYLGELYGKDKNDFYGGCKAFLLPIQWDEPFGLTTIEAMACGVPVVAFNRGAMSEIIQNGKNGFVIKNGDLEGFAKAVGKTDMVSRQFCRENVENNFTIEKMTEEYLDLYQHLLEN